MSDASPVHSYYYSTYHLAGDFVWGVAISSLFLTIANLLIPELHRAMTGVIETIDSFKSAPLVFAAIGFCALVLAALNLIVLRMAVVVRDVVRLLPGRGESTGYKSIYSKNKDNITEMYRQHFPEGPDLPAHSTLTSTEMVNRLSALMKLYNPEGYNHNYRTYTIVAAFRQSAAYTLVLALVLFCRAQGLLGALFLAATILLLLCLRFAVEQSISTEFDFIVSTSRWISDKDWRGDSRNEV